MGYGPSGVYTHDGTAPFSIRVATASLETSIRNKVVAPFATTTARDAAFAGQSSSAKEGIIAYVVNRGGHSYWDATSNAWEWMAVNRILFQGSRPSAAETSGGGGTGVSIILMPTVTLPPGNRLIEVSAYSVVTNIGVTTNGKVPRIFVNGSIRAQGYVPAGTTQVTLAIPPTPMIVSGSVDFDLRGLNSVSEALRFEQSTLTVIDRGPTDA